ncbi:MAG: DUF262 domain-containing HNH endonuclease family protein [Eubacteriales bacterium]|nr:DUF262 domain-containing HNH endonuclease family protein [Eubacteriales bacterium]
MDAHKALITDIFNNSTLLEIPFFQRSYVWKEDLWSRLIDDMEFITKTRKTHFLGSIILKEGKAPEPDAQFTKRTTVVDGQQRLTTFLLFLKVLSLKTGQTMWFDFQFRITGQEIALRHGKNDVDAFDKVMSQESPDKVENSGNSRVIEAYNFFLDHIDTQKLNLMLIATNTMFVKIDLAANEDEQQIFDTLNSLGVNLTTSELLKNYFFSRETVKDYQDKWESVFEKDDETKAYWDMEIETGRVKRAMIDIFFDAFFQMFIQDRKYNISTEDRLMYDRLDNLSQSYQHFINTYCAGDKNVVLSELKKYANKFREIFNPDYCNMAVPATWGIERLNIVIFGLKTTTLIPYTLYIAVNATDQAELDAMCGVLESYILRRMIIHATTKNYNRNFTTLIMNGIKDRDSLVERLVNSTDTTMFVPSDDEVKEGVEKAKLVNLQTKGILYLIESRIRPGNSSTAILGFNNYSLEHLMPKKWRNNWAACASDEEARDRDSKLLTLGNLAIITQSLNSSIRDADWSMKKSGKKNKPGLDECATGLTTMNDVLKKDEWTEADISERGNWLSDQAIQVWKIS